MTGFLLSPFRVVWRRRGVLLETTANEIRARYAGSALGTAWLVVHPLLFLAIYATVYVHVLKVRLPAFSPVEYVALIFCGLIPFLGFAEALSAGVGSITANPGLIRNTLFPVELVPLKAVLAAQPAQIVSTLLLLALLASLGRLGPAALLLPLVWALQIALTAGVVWVLASLNVVLRDLQNAVGLVNLMLMLGSPIAYTADMVPEGLRAVAALNPLHHLIVCYQECLVFGRVPRGLLLPAFAAGSVALWCAGFAFCAKMKRVFADHV